MWFWIFLKAVYTFSSKQIQNKFKTNSLILWKVAEGLVHSYSSTFYTFILLLGVVDWCMYTHTKNSLKLRRKDPGSHLRKYQVSSFSIFLTWLMLAKTSLSFLLTPGLGLFLTSLQFLECSDQPVVFLYLTRPHRPSTVSLDNLFSNFDHYLWKMCWRHCWKANRL